MDRRDNLIIAWEDDADDNDDGDENEDENYDYDEAAEKLTTTHGLRNPPSI